MQQRTGLDCIGYLTEVSLGPVEAAEALSSTPEELRLSLKRQIEEKKRELSRLTFRLEDLEAELQAKQPPPLGQLIKSLFRFS